mgnify:CR=1 FL=1
MSDYRFEKGSAYVGTSTVDRRRQKIFAVAGRQCEVVSFSCVKDVKRVTVDDCDGTEIVKLRDSDGHEYFMSARARADIDEAFRVVGLCKA